MPRPRWGCPPRPQRVGVWPADTHLPHQDLGASSRCPEGPQTGVAARSCPWRSRLTRGLRPASAPLPGGAARREPGVLAAAAAGPAGVHADGLKLRTTRPRCESRDAASAGLTGWSRVRGWAGRDQAEQRGRQAPTHAASRPAPCPAGPAVLLLLRMGPHAGAGCPGLALQRSRRLSPAGQAAAPALASEERRGHGTALALDGSDPHGTAQPSPRSRCPWPSQHVTALALTLRHGDCQPGGSLHALPACGCPRRGGPRPRCRALSAAVHTFPEHGRQGGQTSHRAGQQGGLAEAQRGPGRPRLVSGHLLSGGPGFCPGRALGFGRGQGRAAGLALRPRASREAAPHAELTVLLPRPAWEPWAGGPPRVRCCWPAVCCWPVLRLPVSLCGSVRSWLRAGPGRGRLAGSRPGRPRESRPVAATECPDQRPELQPWSPGHRPDQPVHIGRGQALLLGSSATVHSIHISQGGAAGLGDQGPEGRHASPVPPACRCRPAGQLVIRDQAEPITLRARHILIEDGGELHAGSARCPFQGSFSIVLYGRADDGEQPDPYFGRKFVGVGRGGVLELHGKKKLAWTFLNKTLHPGGMDEGGYFFERSWGHRGVIVHVIDPQVGTVIHSDRHLQGQLPWLAGRQCWPCTAGCKVVAELATQESRDPPWHPRLAALDRRLCRRFDTYQSRRESERLARYLDAVPAGRVLSVAVNDEGSRQLDDTARKAMTRLGSKHFLHLGFRHPWSFLTVKGDPAASVEEHVEFHGHRGPVAARVSKLFRTARGESFRVSSSSEWVQDVEWTEWLDQDKALPMKGGEKTPDLWVAAPGKNCPRPLDIQATSADGANLTTEVVHRRSQDLLITCRDRWGRACQRYRLRFLCAKSARPKLTVTVDTNVNSTTLTLEDEVRSWGPGDTLVVASTDYSMHQAEEFQVLPCMACAPNQVRVAGKPTYLHMGTEVDGVDMRAEVGLLSRNIVVRGETEAECYPYASHVCDFFHFDTFGGHMKFALGFKAVHLEGVELRHMGQQLVGQYPLHFHLAGDVDAKGGYDPPTYVRDLSIHHSFSRCVTVHGSNGLLVQDVVGYDSLGHCFFTEDGPEERNTFLHCLGLLVRPGTLLPSDRDSRMCKAIAEDAYPGYVPRPRQDCNAVSTFWMANPNNNLIDCAAAGSEETGFWFIFHHVPTGPSVGMYPPGYSEHIPLGKFQNNRAHSNYRAGMIIDNGVKTTEASVRDKRPFLSIISARYSPHQDADPLKPREPAIIRHFTAYKNQDHGAWLRGGDVWLDGCRFADNGIGLTLASGGTFPYDEGSRQEVRDSLFVGESSNVGTEMVDNRIWGPGGLDHSGRTLPIGHQESGCRGGRAAANRSCSARDFPIRGIQFYDGPVSVQGCTFRKFAALEGRHTSALAFRLNNAWQSCPLNSAAGLAFEDVPITSRVFFGEPGPWFNQLDMDGDKTAVFHDVDGSVSEYPGAYLTREDNWLVRHPDCLAAPDWRGAICSGHYAQMYVQTHKTSQLRMKIARNDRPDRPLLLQGALARGAHYQQYQPVVALRKGYTVHWDQVAPAELTIWLVNFNRHVAGGAPAQAGPAAPWGGGLGGSGDPAASEGGRGPLRPGGDWVRVGLCYPRGSSFSVVADVHDRLRKRTAKTGSVLRTLQMDRVGPGLPGRSHYFWDEDSGLLFLKLRAQHERERFAFCSVRGCERVRIRASMPRGAGVSDCSAAAYPKFAERPVVDVPMPRKLSGARLKGKDRFLEVRVESSRQRLFHVLSDSAYIEVGPPGLGVPVDGQRFPSAEEGVQVVVVDGRGGHVLGRASFRSALLQGVPRQLLQYVAAIPDHSIVLVASKGRLAARGAWTRVLEKLGADRALWLKEKLVFVGFKGSFRPAWVTLETDDHKARIFQVVPVPVLKKQRL
ncbi:Cell migration-inducing and hyaluronan-binding protein [Galemys pyrenaicus]|uniref:hyaluronoglucosaminidase n=1 Tax=Galemys pyrenaicus TaxID=202257 RepID=A0A8J6DS82_GALPY|nr:Cell migration-inducing and hyaluronan-binding protein [Galemys pyrenaicus]